MRPHDHRSEAPSITTGASCEATLARPCSRRPFARPIRPQVRTAREKSLPIVLVHELDLSRDGCAFDHFFKTTPQELINDGLYNMIAIACHQPPHRDVSRACTKPTALSSHSLISPD